MGWVYRHPSPQLGYPAAVGTPTPDSRPGQEAIARPPICEYAARELAAMGYTNVTHYPEGKQGWMEAGLPVEKAA